MPHLSSTSLPLRIQFDPGGTPVTVRDFTSTAATALAELVHVTNPAGPEPGEARIIFPKLRWNDQYIENTIKSNQLVTIWGSAATDANVLFHGTVMSRFTTFKGTDVVGCLCHDMTEMYARDVCGGKRYKPDAATAARLVLGAPVIFNEGGAPNRNLVQYNDPANWGFVGSGELATLDQQVGATATVCTYWNPIDMIVYVLRHYWAGGVATDADLQGLYESIENMLDTQGYWRQDSHNAGAGFDNSMDVFKPAPEVDVTGLTVPEAINAILQATTADYTFSLRTGAILTGGDVGDYVTSLYHLNWKFFPKNSNDPTRLATAYTQFNLSRPTAGAVLRDIAWANAKVEAGNRNIDNSVRPKAILGYGARKTFESTILLSPGWNNTLAPAASVVASPGLAVPGSPDYNAKFADTLSRYIVPPGSSLSNVLGQLDSYAKFSGVTTYLDLAGGVHRHRITGGTHSFYGKEHRQVLHDSARTHPDTAGAGANRRIAHRVLVQVYVDGKWQRIAKTVIPLDGIFGIRVNPDTSTGEKNVLGSETNSYRWGTFWPTGLATSNLDVKTVAASIFPLRATLRVESNDRLNLLAAISTVPSDMTNVVRYKDFGDQYRYDDARPLGTSTGGFGTVFYMTPGTNTQITVTAEAVYRDDRTEMKETLMRMLDQARRQRYVYGVKCSPLKEVFNVAKTGDFLTTLYSHTGQAVAGWAINRFVVGTTVNVQDQTIELALARTSLSEIMSR